MYLEKLEINGFKSFANKNKLIFSGLIEDEKRGLTAIVGPNGSGKSNVADAIRWALGEQSLKTLRGKRSEDIIFSGSDKKARLGSAEVSLYLNNQDKPSTFSTPVLTEEASENEDNLNKILKSCDEIIITRRIFRNGESEYLLNDNRVRLVDIQMLLAKASFGQKTYSVIGQGMVENFLTVSAAERKDFFDEATGVKQFQIKRESSLNKLEGSYENLRQVDMLLSEIKPRLKSLTRQVDKLKKRSGLETDLKEQQLIYYSHLWHDLNEKLKKANQQLLVFEKEKLEKEKRLEKLNEELIKIQTTNNFAGINELETKLRERESQKNQVLKELARLQAEMETKLEAQGQFDLSWLKGKKAELETSLENITFEIDSLKKSFPEKEEAASQESLKHLKQEFFENRKEQEGKNTIEREINDFENKISRLETIVAAKIEAEKEIDLNLLQNKEKEITLNKQNLEQNLSRLMTDKEQSNRSKLEENIQNLEAEIASLNNSLSEINKKLKENKEKLEAKEEIEKLVDDFLLRLDQINKETDLERVKQLVAEAKKEFGNKIKILISGKDEKALEEIRTIQEKIIELSEKKQIFGSQLAEEVFRLKSLQEKIISNQERLKEENNNLQEIIEKIKRAEIKFNFSAAEDEKRGLEKQIELLKISLEELKVADKEKEIQEKISKAEEKLQEIAIKKSSLNERLRLLTEKHNNLKNETQGIINKIEKGETKFDAGKIAAEEKALNEKITSLNTDIVELRTKLDSLQEERDKEKGLMFELQKNSQSRQQELNILNSDLSKIQQDAVRQEAKLEDLEASIRNDNLVLLEIESYDSSHFSLDNNSQEIESLPKKIASLKNHLDQIGGIDPEVEKEYEETKTRYDFLKTQTEDLDKTINSLEEIITELDKNIKKKFDTEFKVISEKFTEYFKILFNGGEAKISKLSISEDKNEPAESQNSKTETLSDLVDEDEKAKNEIDKKLKKIKDLRKYGGGDLEGIDIQAVPPGKKIQTVTMLSGGERALTAIALICAIISANPSPFVVLDEVDAALDEANSERLARILDDLSNKTQFIVITHNRASMRKASILYGVTMQADGVSQLLSVKLDEIEKNKK